MLCRIHISNYLLMEELDLPLHKGLSIITGETGSGKSIIIGALALAMGERADIGVLRDPTKRCIIELEAELGSLSLQSWFDRNELPFERYTLIRRQLEPNGRSRAFINDTPVKLEQLRELGARLVHVHSQHHTLLLNDPKFQLGMVDHGAGETGNAAEYVSRYKNLRAIQKELEELRSASARSAAELDLLRFQLNELEEAALKPDEQQQIEQELSRAENAGEILQALNSVAEGIGSDRGALDQITLLHRSLVKTARIDPAIDALLNRLGSVQIELKDISAEAEDLATKVEIDPTQAERLRERVDLLLRLQQKHRVKSDRELLALQEEFSSRISTIGAMDERIPQLEKEEEKLKADVIARARVLSIARGKAAGILSDQVEKILHQLGMEHAVFKFDHRTWEEPGALGVDQIKAMFSANLDRAPSPLDKVASGGELSRVMLAMISLAAASQGLPTVIFDEIDTGVSGEVADKVGSLMARMSKDRQILAITHLPQIASKAGTHMLVTKETKGETVRSRITPLDHAQRVEAIAQMLSGRKLTKAALENAKVLLKADS